MFFRKPLKGKKTQIKVSPGQFVGGIESVVDEHFLGQHISKISFNVSGATGSLKHRFGFSELKDSEGDILDTPLPAKMVWFLDNGIICHHIALLDDNRLYCFDKDQSGQKAWREINGGIQFQQQPTAVSYKLNDVEVLIFSSNVDGMYYYNGSLIEVSDAPKLSSLAVHSERLFGVTGNDNILWFSDDLNPTNWNVSIDEAGFIELADEKGKILKVVSFLTYIYMFREYGISRLYANGSQEDFSISHAYNSSGKIYGNTVCNCGGIVFFLSQDGFFSFDGADTRKKLFNLDNLLNASDNSNAYATYAEGKYLLALKMNFDDNLRLGCENKPHTNNAMLVFDLYSSEQVLLRGVDIRFLGRSTDTAKTMICFNGQYNKKIGTLSNSGCCFDDSFTKNWTTPTTDFGFPAVEKHLKYVILYTRYDIRLSVICDEKQYNFEISGSIKAQKIPLNIFGQQFSFCYQTDFRHLEVTKPKFVFSVIGAFV